MAADLQRIETRISPDILDTIGRSFRFSHGKGVAEWLKNSLDHYLRLYDLGQEPRSGNWPVLINLIDAPNQRKGPNLAVVDFGGTGHQHINEYFLHWGDTSAATFGGETDRAPVTGGHGNGGKFYMREMWKDGARFLTWCQGKATSLIVDKADDGTTGAWELKDQSMGWKDAMSFAVPEDEALGGSGWILEHLAQDKSNLRAELDAGQRGFSIIVGRRAVQRLSSNDVVRGGRWDHQRLVDDIRDAPQARRPIRELVISVFVDGALRIPRLTHETFEPDPDWDTAEIPLPSSVVLDAALVDDAQAGLLRIRKSAQQLVGRHSHWNAISVLDGDSNPIAMYPMRELPWPGHSPIISFMHGELILTFSGLGRLVANDRERLVSSPTTQAIIEWIVERVWERVRSFERKQKQAERRSELEVAALLNKQLNKHARRFLEQLQTEILVDLIEDDEGGGLGDAGRLEELPPAGSRGNGSSARRKGGQKGNGGTVESPGRTRKLRRSRFPRVLLSRLDPDPSRDDGGSKDLTVRHPPLEQDDVDRQHNVWWINTLHPFAEKTLDHGGAEGSSFKSYQLFMFQEVVQRESLRILQRRQAELGLDVVENELSEVSNRFLGELPHDLAESLLV